MKLFLRLNVTGLCTGLALFSFAQSDFNPGAFGGGGGISPSAIGNSGTGNVFNTIPWEDMFKMNNNNSTNNTSTNRTAATTSNSIEEAERKEANWLQTDSKKVQTTQIAPRALLQGVDVAYKTFKFNVQQGAKLQLDNGTTIEIPKDALVDKTGKRVEGEAELQYREFHHAADIIASGIPMHDSETGNYMETAGMFDMKANQADKELAIAPDKTVKVKMASYNEGNDFDFWKYDAQKGNWSEIDGAGQIAAQPSRRLKSENPVTPNTSATPLPAEITRSFGINSFGIHNWDKLRARTQPESKKVVVAFDENAGVNSSLDNIPFFWVTREGRSVVCYAHNDLQKVSFTPYSSDALVAILPDNKVATFTGKDFGKIDRSGNTLVYDFKTAPQRIETVAQFTKVLDLK